MSSALVTPGQQPTHFTTVSSLRKWSLKSVLLRCGCPLWVRSRHLDLHEGCPLYPRKRTFSEAAQMSAKCQKRTSEYPSRMLA